MIKLRHPMYEHQVNAFEKIKKYKVGALHMEMGTGKTRTILEVIRDKENKIDKVLWLCPCSAKINIKNELEKQLVSGHELFVIAGIESLSSSIRLNSYLLDFVEKYRTLMVVDESTKIKNINTKRAQRVIYLGSKCKYRYILSGNPIPKNELDLFGQYYFLDWRILGYKSEYTFQRYHAVFDKEVVTKIIDTKNTDYLAARIEPYSYKIKLDDCIDLPGKIYKEYDFGLNLEQSNMYYALAERLMNNVNDWNPSSIYRLFSILQGVTAGFLYKGERMGKVGYLSNVYDNPRLEALMDVVREMTGKVIIFCEYIKEVETICGLLNKEYGKNSAVVFDGQTSIKKRNKNIEKFKAKSRFLVANKDCAAYSLNLQFCHQVIFYNNDWDFGTREQAEDRIYRIGQKEKCLYIDITCSNTIENYVIDCLRKKASLADRFMQDIKEKDLEKIIRGGKRKSKIIDAEDLVDENL